jgi:hypothetical protein
MKRPIIIILSLMVFSTAGFAHASAVLPAEKAKETAIPDPESYGASQEDMGKKALEDFKASKNMLYDKMVKRTNGCKDELDNMFLMTNNLYRQAVKDKDAKKEKELVLVMSDYNSVLGDLGLMQSVLEMKKFADDEEMLDYCMFMENAFDKLKDSYSLNNEIFLDRIDNLRTYDALRYEKMLLRAYREYFEYDPKRDTFDVDKDKAGNIGKKNPGKGG